MHPIQHAVVHTARSSAHRMQQHTQYAQDLHAPMHVYVVLLGQSFFCELPGHEPSHQRLLGLCVSKFKHR